MLRSNLRYHVAKQHIAGPDLEDAEAICKWSSANGWSTTISVWTHPEEDKKSVAKKYASILKIIYQNKWDSYLSIKPSSLEFDSKLFESILKDVPDRSVRIHFDSLSPTYAEPSLRYFRRIKTIYDNLGFTIPARWFRSLNDAKALAEMGIPVRIVKGQWKDPSDIKIDVAENFLKIIGILVDKIPLIAIATHDLRLAEKSIEILNKSETDFELEQFFSLPLIVEPVRSQFNLQNKKIRIYIAYGEPYLPYNLKSFVKERPAMMWWLARDLFNPKRKYNQRYNNITEMSV